MGIRHNELMLVKGRLTQIGLSFRAGGKAGRHAVFRCECGETKVTEVKCVREGNTQSCGCYNLEQVATRIRDRQTTHGKTGSAEHRAWVSMLARVRGTGKEKDKQHYFDRGIKCCERWLKFENFLEDMGKRPSSKHSIDRRENEGDYEPSNCSWATLKEQNQNRRNNLNFTMNGKTQCMSAWAREAGINIQTLYYRISNGWPFERAITESVKKNKKETA